MSFGGIISQGKFTQASTAVAKFVAIPSGVDRMEVINYTASDGSTSGAGTSYLWQRGMATDGGLIYYHPAGDQTLAVDAMSSGGFTLVDSESVVVGAGVNVNSITSGTSVVLNVSSTVGIVDGVSVVRVLKPSGKTLADGEPIIGQDFLVASSVANTSITLVALATDPAIGAGTAQYKIVYTDTAFYPRSRVIADITAGTTTAVYTTVPHGLTVGQEIRFSIPSTSGMVQLNPTTENLYLSATVISIDSTDLTLFTVDIDSSSFTAFSYPTSAQDPFSFPRITPIGENTATAISNNVGISKDAKVNTAQLGMILGLGSDATAGKKGPAGAANNVMYWSAWKAANVTQE